jgi:hypothetical protein
MSRGLKITFLAHAIVSLAFGLVLYLIPDTWVALVNWAPYDPAITRIYAAALLGLCVSSWLGYRATRWDEVRIVVQMEIVVTVLGGLAGLYSALLAGAPLFIWVSVVIYLGFSAAWIYFYQQAKA